jgi:hypothetical protein
MFEDDVGDMLASLCRTPNPPGTSHRTRRRPS